MEKIKLVVVDERVLGYIRPERPNEVCVLSAPATKGGQGSSPIYIDNKKVRMATEQDFDEYRVMFDGYKKDPIYEYQK